MKLYKLTIDADQPSSWKNMLVAKNQDFLLAIRAQKNGITQSDLDLEYDDDTCAIECSYEFEDYNVYKFNLSSDITMHAHLSGDISAKIAMLNIDTDDVSEIDVDYTSISADTPDPYVPPIKVKFLDWNKAVQVTPDGENYVYVLPGTEIETSSLQYLGFALIQDLSGNSQGTELSDMKLAQGGFQVSTDTAVVKHQMGYSLWNESGVSFNILKNRSSNVKLNDGSYTSNVACFITDQLCPIAAGKLSTVIPVGTEFWLSCNSTIYNPLG